MAVAGNYNQKKASEKEEFFKEGFSAIWPIPARRGAGSEAAYYEYLVASPGNTKRAETSTPTKERGKEFLPFRAYVSTHVRRQGAFLSPPPGVF